MGEEAAAQSPTESRYTSRKRSRMAAADGRDSEQDEFLEINASKHVYRLVESNPQAQSQLAAEQSSRGSMIVGPTAAEDVQISTYF